MFPRTYLAIVAAVADGNGRWDGPAAVAAGADKLDSAPLTAHTQQWCPG